MGSKITPIQQNFNGGEIDAHLAGRTDIERYFTSAQTVENFIPLVQGPVKRRNGRRFVAPAMGQSRLVEFQLSVQQSYVLEFANGRLRFFKPGSGQVIRASATMQAPFTIGSSSTLQLDQVINFPTSGNISLGLQYDCHYTGISGTTLTGVTVTSPTNGVTFPAGAAVFLPYEIATPYGDVWYLKFAQSNDVMYISHPNYPPMKLNHLSDTNWTLTSPAFRPPPMNEIGQDISRGTGLSLSGLSGTIVMNAGTPVFIAADVGRAIVAGQGLGFISSVGGTTGTDPSGAITYLGVNVEVVDPFDSGSYGTGAWFLKGSPQSYFSVGIIDTSTGSKQWKSSRKLGQGGLQLAYGFQKFPQDNIAPPPFEDTWRSIDVGRYIVSGGAVMQIKQVLSAHEVNVEMLSAITETFTDTNGVIRAISVSGGDWSIEDPTYTGSRGYPSVVAFFQDRLWYSGSATEPQTLYGSVTSDYENFSKGEQDTDSVSITINNGKQDNVNWLMPFQSMLIAGTQNGEYALGAGQAVVGGNGPAITPSNATSMVQSAYGTAYIQPIQVENQLLYVQRAQYTVYEMAYSIYSSVLASIDLNLFRTLEDTAGIKHIRYQQTPQRTVWVLTLDGQLRGLTYKKDDQVWGWSNQPTGELLDDPIESLAVVPGPGTPGITIDSSRDILYTVVGRPIPGVPVSYPSSYAWWIEYDDPTLNTDGASQSLLTSPASVIGGLQYISGMNVHLKVDGAFYGLKKVAPDGTLAINPPGQNIEVGIPYTSTLLTNRLQERQGANIQGLLKNWNTLWVRVNQSLGFKINGTRALMRKASTPMDGPVAAFTGDVEAKTAPKTERDAVVLVEQDQPFNCEILAIFGQVNVGEI